MTNYTEVKQDAQEYANMINRSVLIMKRGNQYKTSQIEHAGWRVTEIVIPVLLSLLVAGCFVQAFLPL